MKGTKTVPGFQALTCYANTLCKTSLNLLRPPRNVQHIHKQYKTVLIALYLHIIEQRPEISIPRAAKGCSSSSTSLKPGFLS